MQKIILNSREIECEIKKNKRVRRLSVSVSYDCKLNVNVPWACGNKIILDFIEKNADWILEKIDHFSQFKGKIIIKTSRKEYLKYKEIARKLVKERIAHFNKFYNFKFNRIAIKNQKTLWGSCSANGNLNFNYVLALVSPKIADYIVVHEMCHLWHFDHSKEFWKLVSLTIPDYKEIREETKNIHF